MKKKNIYGQSFTNFKTPYLYDDKDCCLVKGVERIDLQKQMNSHYDECLISYLEKLIPDISSSAFCGDNISVDDTSSSEDVVEFVNLFGVTKADKLLSAMSGLDDIASRAGIEDYSIYDFYSALKDAVKGGELNGIQKENESQSKSQEFSSTGSEDSQA